MQEIRRDPGFRNFLGDREGFEFRNQVVGLLKDFLMDVLKDLS